MQRLNFQMLEEQPIGTKLTTLQATDADSNIEAYRLSSNDYFDVNNLTGLYRHRIECAEYSSASLLVL